ncbi:hypothetical protein [Verrucomicrobium sp. 3C]|uniref:hypothetical protein n=1 Tax=Verrucomicrobium sp. 3C TaxID=1134055 RepID=UPI0034E0E106
MDDNNLTRPMLIETLVHAALRSGPDVMTCAVSFFEGSQTPLGGAVGTGACGKAFGDADPLRRREAFWRIAGYSADYRVLFQDRELLAEALLSGLRLQMVREALFSYRVHHGRMSRATASSANHERSVRRSLRHDPRGLAWRSHTASSSSSNLSAPNKRCKSSRTKAKADARSGRRWTSLALVQRSRTWRLAGFG